MEENKKEIKIKLIGEAYYLNNNQYESVAVDDDGNYYRVRYNMLDGVSDERVADDESRACDWSICDCILDEDFAEVEVLDFDGKSATIIPRQ